MPRKSRIDAHSALHHIIARGIDRKTIFKDHGDRDNFLDRLGNILSETHTVGSAWALIPNHFHLLLRTGTTAISTVIRRLLTGYAVSYNFRYRRPGQLFQNRDKSIHCSQFTVFLGNDGVGNQPDRVSAKAKDFTACSQHVCQGRGKIGQPQQLFAQRLKVTYNLMSLKY
jgi:REP element-mobilizing transposase RayT